MKDLTEVDLWARNESNKYIFTVEHRFPQGEEIPVEWVNDIANGDIEKAKEVAQEVSIYRKYINLYQMNTMEETDFYYLKLLRIS